MEMTLPFSVKMTQGPLFPWKQKGWDLFFQQGMPTKKHPGYKTLSLRPLLDSHFNTCEVPGIVTKEQVAKRVLPSCLHSHLVFVDGHLDLDLSDVQALVGVKISTLEEGFSQHASFLQTRFQKSLEENDPLTLLNVALFDKGAFIYVPSHLQISSPLQLIHLTTATQPSLIAPRIHVALGRKSSLSCFVTTDLLLGSCSHWHLPAIDVFVDEQAQCSLFEVVRHSLFTASLSATIKQEGSFSMTGVCFGGEVSRSSYRIDLQGDASSAEVNALSLLEGAKTHHLYGTISHKAPHTRSMQRCKAVLEERSKTSYSGKIVVDPQAQKTEAYQLHKTLLLSPHSIVSSEPNLEIGADDVKASHGSTISQISPSELFYFQTRGIDQEVGKRLLQQGFCEEILAKMPKELVARSFL